MYQFTGHINRNTHSREKMMLLSLNIVVGEELDNISIRPTYLHSIRK